MHTQPENVKNKLVLIDGNGLAYRSFYAVPFTKFAMGLPSNAILGCANLLLTIIVTEKPTHIVVAFDHAAFTERLLKRQSYNVQREDMPDELSIQLPVVEDFVRACGLKSVRLSGFEADDCIGTLASRAQRDGLETLIVSGDLELLQLVAPGVRVLTTRRGIADSVIYDEELVRRKYNLNPSQLADLRALAGDSSQNIGGVPGIGEVTARRLLSQFSDLNDLFDSLEQLPAKWRNPLSENRAEAMEFKNRATIKRDLPLDLCWDDCRFQGFPVQLIRRALGKVDAVEEFEYLFKRMEPFVIAEPPATLPERALAGDEAREAMAACLAGSGPVAVVLLVEGGQDKGIAIDYDDQAPFYIALGEGDGCVASDEVWQSLTQVFADASRPKYVCRLRDIYNQHPVCTDNVLDVGLAYEVIEPGAWEHSLEALCARYGLVMYDHLILFGLGKRPFDEIPLDNKICWTAQAASVLRKLGPLVQADLDAQCLGDVYRQVDLPLSLQMGALDKCGVCFDSAVVDRVDALLQESMNGLRDVVHAESNTPFDIDNDKELGDFLFEQLCLLVPTRPKNGGVISTDILASLVGQHQLAVTVRNYRELSAFRRCFVEGFLRQRHVDVDVDGYLFNPALVAERHLQLMGKVSTLGTVTAIHRMCSVVNNLLEVGVRAGLRRLLGEALVPVPGHSLLVARFDQPGLRILAHLAQDTALSEALETKCVVLDYFQANFEEEPYRDFPDESERMGTRVILNLLGNRWLARALNVEEEEAEKIATRMRLAFAEQFPVSWAFMNNCVDVARNMQPLRTLSGRSQRIHAASSRNHDVNESGERWARSMCVEGSFADILRKSSVEIPARLAQDGVAVYLMCVFGQIMMSVPADKVAYCAAKVREVVKDCSYGVHMPITLASGSHLRSLTPVE